MRFVLRLTCGAALACAAGALLSAQADSTIFSDLIPRSIGPATTSGRITALDVATSDPRLMYGSVLSYGGAPTTSQVQYTSVLSSRLDSKKKSFESLTSRRLDDVNASLKSAGENPVHVPTREELDKR